MPAISPDSDPTPFRDHTGGEIIPTDEHGLKRQPKTYPTRWQKKVLWMAITGTSLLTLGALTVLVMIISGRVLGYLQSFILPVAVAAVLTYLLAPLVDKLRDRFGLPHKRAALLVFLGFLLGGGILIACIAVPVAHQISQLGQSTPYYYRNFENLLEKNLSPEGFEKLVQDWEKKPITGPIIKMSPFSSEAMKKAKEKAAKELEAEKAKNGAGDAPLQQSTEPPMANGPAPAATGTTSNPAGSTPTPTGPTPQEAAAPGEIALPGLPAKDAVEAMPPPENLNQVRDWLAVQIPLWAKRAWQGLLSSIGGVLGFFGFILNFLLVPIYLFFFLRETHSIQANWSNYLPLRASRFKDEIVDLVQEVNGYLIAFFRGQMLVSMIDGFFIAIFLSIIGLKFGLLIGVLVGILGLIPYIGLMSCLIPAVIIGIVQGAQGDWHFFGMQHPAWWLLPVLVIATFVVVNNLDNMIVAPKIVGDSVGLHPLLIIASVLFWSLCLGGLLGALLAVPLTATCQVLFRRYIWQRQHADGEEPPHNLGPPQGPPPSTAIIPAPPTAIIAAESVPQAPSTPRRRKK